MIHSNFLEAYATYIKAEARTAMSVEPEGKVRPADLKKHLTSQAIHIGYSDHSTEKNLAHTKVLGVELGGNEMLNIKTMASFLSGKQQKMESHRWTMAIIAKILGLQTEEQFRSKGTWVPKNVTPYEAYFKEAILGAEKTFDWESCLLLLVHQLSKSSVEKLTISIDDLRFVFKAMPTLIQFIRRDKRIHLVYAPRHGYGLIAVKELIALWKLGVAVTLLDVKESLSETAEIGFIFNWLPDEGVVEETHIHGRSVEMMRVRTTSFDRYPFSTLIRCNEIGELRRTIQNILKKVNGPYAHKTSPKIQTVIRKVDKREYEFWFKERYTTHPNSLYHNCSFELVKVPVRSLYYRNANFIRYKVLQAYEILRASGDADMSETHSFHPYAIFGNGTRGLYATTPPIVEFNPIAKRLEVADGPSRLLAAIMINPQAEVQVLVVKGIALENFNENGIAEDTIDNDWNSALMKITDYHRAIKQVYKFRNIEMIAHAIDDSAYQELGDWLLESGLLSNQAEGIGNEAAYFSHRRYKPDK